MAVMNSHTGQEWLFAAAQIADGLRLLDTADVLVGHNGIGFDLPAIKKVTGWEPKPNTEIRDSMLWSMLLFPDMRGKGKAKKPVVSDDDDDDIEEIITGHSLEAWGKRLKCFKGNFEGPWDAYTPEMGAYCSQDVRVTEALRRHLTSLNCTSELALKLETRFATLAQRMEARGFGFDLDAAHTLLETLQSNLERLRGDLVSLVPATVTEMKTPQYYVADWGREGLQTQFETKGVADAYRKLHKIKPKECTITAGPLRVDIEPFNPGSRAQVRKYLYEKHGWLSPKLTEGGEKLLETQSAEELAKDYGSLKEDILRESDIPECQKFADLFLTEKVKSFLKGRQEGTGWLALLKPDGKIHHRMLTIGAVTGRCAHSGPNLGQVPSVIEGKDGHPLLGLAGRYGWECRSLFHADRVQVGVDMAAIEARNLAHYLFPYDGGLYKEQVLFGDIHQQNVVAIKKYAHYTVSRKESKNTTYAWFYGGGNLKLGSMMTFISPEAMSEYIDRRNYYRRTLGTIKDKIWSKATNSKRLATPEEAAFIGIGAKVRTAYEKGIAGLEGLLADLKERSKRGYLFMPDGRRVPIRSPHAALNCLLQGSAAVLMKKWVTLTEDYNLRDGVDWFPLAIVHDELQSDVHPDSVTRYGHNCIQAIKDAGAYFRWTCPLDGEVKIGKNWAACH